MRSFMRKALLFMTVISLLTVCGLSPAEADNSRSTPGKVIFDTDMTYLYDDAIAMFMLTQAARDHELELLGITTVGGNAYVSEATTAALRQLD